MIATHWDTFAYGFFFGAGWIVATGACRAFWLAIAAIGMVLQGVTK